MTFCMIDKIQRNLRMETDPLPKFHNPVILHILNHCQNPLNLLLVLIYVIAIWSVVEIQYQTDMYIITFRNMSVIIIIIIIY